MKGATNLRLLQQKKQEKEVKAWIEQPVCCVCSKQVEGYYARYQSGGVCSGACMKVQDAKPRYPGFSESDYFKRLEATT